MSISKAARSPRHAVQRMVLGVRADGVAGGADLPDQLRMGAGLAADHEEHGLQALVGQRLEHMMGVGRERSVVEGQHDLAGRKRQRDAVIVRADQRHGARIDRHHAADAERIRIGAGRRHRVRAAERNGARDHGQAKQTKNHGIKMNDARRCGGVTARNLAARAGSRRETGVHHEAMSLTRAAAALDGPAKKTPAAWSAAGVFALVSQGKNEPAFPGIPQIRSK